MRTEEDREICSITEQCYEIERVRPITGTVLNPDDIFTGFREFDDDLRLNKGFNGGGDIIDENRESRTRGDCLIKFDQICIVGGGIVVARCRSDGINTKLFSDFNVLDNALRACIHYTTDNRDTPTNCFESDVHCPFAFCIC